MIGTLDHTGMTPVIELENDAMDLLTLGGWAEGKIVGIDLQRPLVLKK